MITGPARDWLAAKRQELNGRFRLAHRRFPRLSPETVLSLCREVLPPLAGAGEPGNAELLASVYELILLHAGRAFRACRRSEVRGQKSEAGGRHRRTAAP